MLKEALVEIINAKPEIPVTNPQRRENPDVITIMPTRTPVPQTVETEKIPSTPLPVR